MKPVVTDDGTVLVPTSIVGGRGELGDVMQPLVPTHPLYAEWTAWIARHPPTAVRESVALDRMLDRLREYSDDEPRDDRGKWTGGGSSDTSSARDSLIAGRAATVSAADAPALVSSLASHDAPVDISNLHVSGADDGNLFDKSATPIGRGDMPQVTGSTGKLGDFQSALAREGYTYTLQQASPLDLHATQSEINGQAVGRIYNGFDPERAAGHTLIVSSDGAVLDGHHTWAAGALHALDNPGYTMSVMRVDAPISDMLRTAYSVSGATKAYGVGSLT